MTTHTGAHMGREQEIRAAFTKAMNEMLALPPERNGSVTIHFGPGPEFTSTEWRTIDRRRKLSA
jgi:hypothetical protein